MTTSPFDKDYDTILLEILTDYNNLDSAPDISAGSMPYITGSVLASMLWGLYRYQDWVLKQLFPDKAITEYLNHWGSIYNISRLSTDTDATYLNKILSYMRQAPAGGNALDFENWALDQDNSYVTYGGTTYYNAFAHVVSCPGGILGTVGIYTIPNDETIVNGNKSSGTNTGVTANKLVDSGATFQTDGVAVGDPVTNTSDNLITTVSAIDSETTLSLDDNIFTATPKNYSVDGAEELLRRATEDYIESKRPLGMLSQTVYSADPQTQAVTMTVTAPEGGSIDTSLISDAIENLLNGMAPGETLHKSTLEYTAHSYGAASAIVTVPSGETNTIDDDKYYRPGTITVTET